MQIVIASGNKVRLTDLTIQSLISQFAYTQNSRETHTKGLLAYIDPFDFLCNTSSPATIRRIEQETGPLDFAALKKAGLPELQLQKVGTEYKTIGHEGRHRMVALGNAGYHLVPTILSFFNAVDFSGPQQFTIQPQSHDGGFRTLNVTAYPISYAGERDLASTFKR